MPQLSLLPNSVAVITGGAAGIGLAAAMQFARLGLKVCIADIGKDSLSSAAAKLSKAAPDGAASVMTWSRMSVRQPKFSGWKRQCASGSVARTF